MKKQLLIIGGGFAGFWSALSAIRQSRALNKEEELEITMVNLDHYLTIRPRLYEVSLDGLRVELEKYLKPLGVHLIIGKAEMINPQTRKVTVSTSYGTRDIDYDYLILSSGSQLKGMDIPGIAESFNLDTFNNAQKLEDHLIELSENDFSQVGAATFIVVGSGLTGLEAATTIREKAESIQSKHSDKRIDFKVVLIEKAEKVASYYSKEAQAYVSDTLKAKNIEVITGTTLIGIQEDNALLSNGTKIPSKTIICSVGMVASPLTGFFSGERDGMGRLLVDEFLKLPAYENVIVAGDVANIPVDKQGNKSLMACQFSMNLGKWGGHNAVNDIFSSTLKPYAYTSYVTCLDLGQDDGLFTTGWERKLLYQGREGKDIKVKINEVLIYPLEDVEETVAQSYPQILY